MKNLLTSIPFDQNLEIASMYLSKHPDYRVFSIVDHIYSVSIKSDERITRIPKFDNFSKYMSYDMSSYPINYTDGFYRYKYNLIQIVNRWIRTYNISDDFINLDYVSSRILQYWNDYLIGNNIKKIILGNIPHTPHDYSIYLIAKIENINLIILQPFTNPTSNVRRYLVLRDLSWENPIINSESVLGEDLPDDLVLLKNSDLKSKDKVIPKQIYVDENVSLRDLIRRKTYSPLLILKKAIGRLVLFVRFLNEKIYLYKIRTQTVKIFPDGNFIFFPLHFQPEATTIPTGNIFADQSNIIRLISSKLPSSHVLVVKEHPAYWRRNPLKNLSEYTPIKSVRPKWFYKELVENSNILFVDSELDSHELIRLSKGVVTVSGTIALEAALINRTTIIFGEHYYSKLDSVIQYQTMKDIDIFINRIEVNKVYNFNRFLQLVGKNSIELTNSNLLSTLNSQYLNNSEIVIYLFEFLDLE